MSDFKNWKHVFKLDPNKPISEAALEAICESGTDAVIVGGTDGITIDNTLDMLARIRRFSVDCALEVSVIEALTPGFDYYFIPTVLNSQQTKWVIDLQHTAVKEFGEIMNWEEIIVEGYCILNDEAKVAKMTQANTNLDREDVVAYARIAENMFQLPVFYIEYSGTYGDMEIVKQAKAVLTNTKLFYGGGITSEAKATEAATHADTIIVGNLIYDDLQTALQTVNAVKR